LSKVLSSFFFPEFAQKMKEERTNEFKEIK